MPSYSATTKGGVRVQVAVYGVRDSATFRTKREAVAWGCAREHKLRTDALAKRDLAEKLGVSYGSESAHSILSHKIPLHNVPGVYILFMDNSVTYVGKSVNALSRIASHAEKGRRFTHYHVIPCLPEDLDSMEEHYIKLLDPHENKALTGNLDARGRIKKSA